ncbi:MAG: D-tyrosyl-tRNA(Tyr) deacylase [Phycisphaerales bacterium]|nr:D-tyrosyl-tRNA(Tyr) deacylase [Phycisphaerales bacterium]
MKCVVQRVSGASLDADGAPRAVIGAGLVVLVAVVEGDAERDLDWTADKVARLRVFEDDAGKMNLSLLDTGGEVLLVPNFTVAGDARKGRRPSFDGAMRPPEAAAAFDALADALRGRGVRVETGVFGAHMQVRLVNDGPVTLVLDSRA